MNAAAQPRMNGKTAILIVPCVIVPQERNYILNPARPDFKALGFGVAEPFLFDPCLK